MLREIAITLVLATLSFGATAQEIRWWEDARDVKGSCCHPEELEEVQVLLEHYYHRAILVARREDEADKATFGQTYNAKREQKLIEDQNHWKEDADAKCNSAMKKSGMTAMDATFFSCQLHATLARIQTIEPKSVP